MTIKTTNIFEYIGRYTVHTVMIAVILYFAPIYTYMTGGYVLTLFWDWFIPDLIEWKPDYWQAVGLLFISRYIFMSSLARDGDNSTVVKLSGFFMYIATPWIALFTGYMIYNRFLALRYNLWRKLSPHEEEKR